MLSVRRDRSTVPDVIDLTDDLSITFRLLDDTHAWRHRLVEEELLGDGDHLTATSGYQVELPPALMSKYVREAHHRRVKLILPLTTKPKRPLLQFSLDGPGGSPAQLLLRSSVSVIQASYLRVAAASSPASSVLRQGMSAALLEAVCGFTPAPFEEYLADRSEVDAYHDYLQDGLGVALTKDDVIRWVDEQDETAEVLARALGEPRDPLSSSDQVLLSLPRLHERIRSRGDIERIVEEYHHAVRIAARSGDEYFLTALADYGRRWEVFVELEVPIEEPCQVRLHEIRPVSLDSKGWIRSSDPVPIGEARSGHLQVRLADPHVEIVDFEVIDASTGSSVAVPLIESVRYTRESLALYSSAPERPYYVELAVRLRVVRGIRLSYWFVGALTAAAAFVAPFVPESENLVDTLAFLTVPTTFAVALVLVRESSTIAVRLQRRARTVIVGLAVLLWVVSIFKLMLWW